MSGLCGILRLDGGPVDSAELERMVARAPYRGCDGIHYHYQPGFGLACLSLDTSPDGTGACCPVIVSNGKIVFGADARLDNRAECLQWQANLPIQRQAQGVAVDSLADSRGPRTDSEVMLGTIQHDRVAGPGRLVGDFAYALWDATTLRLRLARDAMGMRSLYYRIEKDRVLFATEVCQILAADDVPRRLNETAIAWHLADLQLPPGCVFYSGINEVVPGEEVEIDLSASVRRRTIWRPDPGEQVRYADSREYSDHFRSLLVDAVRCRSRLGAPAAISLSGGMDSGSVASMAGWLAEQGDITSVMRAYSWVFTEHPECDERENIYRIAERFGMPVTEIPAEQTYPLSDHEAYTPDEDSPFMLIYQGFFDRLLSLARGDGCNSAWFGFRGDVAVGGIIPDVAGLLRERRWGEAYRELGGLRHGFQLSRRQAVWRYGAKPLLSDYLRALAPLASMKFAPPGDDFLSSFVPRDRLPPFVTPGFATHADLPARDPVVGASSGWRYATHRERFRHLYSPMVMSVMRLSEQRCARFGMTMVDPWSDRRLASFVLACPAHEVDRFRETKRLARRAVRGVMPDRAIQASRKVVPTPLYEHALRHSAHSQVLALMTDSRSAALGVIDEAKFRALFRRHCAGDLQQADFWPAILLELWLRRWWS